MKDKFGWLAPSGKFIECKPYQHLEVAAKEPEMLKISEVFTLIDSLQELEQEHEELAVKEGSGNAEWHMYEMACDDARYKLVKYFYRSKFIRIGTSKGTMYFEGLPNVLKSRHQQCVDFAESLGMDYEFEPYR